MGAMVVAAGLATFSLFFAGQQLTQLYPSDQGLQFLTDLIPVVLPFLQGSLFYQYVVPSVFVFFLLAGTIIWILIAIFTASIGKNEGSSEEPPVSAKSGKKDFIDHKIEQERRQRLFLHTLSVLQREGRMLDFLDEDLTVYDDSQIGAAVRSIQEDCKKAVKKYIDPKPVVAGEEGDAITIEDGFDIDAINLVGNVSGHPPFEGIIRHPGWRAGKKDVPKLSDVQDPGIMTPAEIEIQ